MSDWRPIDRVVSDWDDPEVEPWERRLLSQTEVEQRFRRRREREQEREEALIAPRNSKR
jgi:hypothetical protein